MIELRRLMEEGSARIYTMRVERLLLTREFVLAVSWGRVGWKSRRREESFPSFQALARRAKALLSRRRNHGYRVVFGSAAALLAEPVS